MVSSGDVHPLPTPRIEDSPPTAGARISILSGRDSRELPCCQSPVARACFPPAVAVLTEPLQQAPSLAYASHRQRRVLCRGGPSHARALLLPAHDAVLRLSDTAHLAIAPHATHPPARYASASSVSGQQRCSSSARLRPMCAAAASSGLCKLFSLCARPDRGAASRHNSLRLGRDLVALPEGEVASQGCLPALRILSAPCRRAICARPRTTYPTPTPAQPRRRPPARPPFMLRISSSLRNALKSGIQNTRIGRGVAASCASTLRPARGVPSSRVVLSNSALHSHCHPHPTPSTGNGAALPRPYYTREYQKYQTDDPIIPLLPPPAPPRFPPLPHPPRLPAPSYPVFGRSATGPAALPAAALPAPLKSPLVPRSWPFRRRASRRFPGCPASPGARVRITAGMCSARVYRYNVPALHAAPTPRTRHPRRARPLRARVGSPPPFTRATGRRRVRTVTVYVPGHPLHLRAAPPIVRTCGPSRPPRPPAFFTAVQRVHALWGDAHI
ncbi:hypothetical protein B0H15DRAFT_955755 [Mycena belliarum]|uniref:Uncharacterized protein n=1 Tax=Mycena belliarum TaxID=1033014 RepID=A0AAD6XMX7_9AGAR|nr:hypothetical protein B0H15DRAFT_955755 [Mycena belliae]